MNARLKRNIALLSIFSFFHYFAFWQPIKQLYLYSIGANEAALAIGVAIWTMSQFALEIPSGYISDTFGKKRAFYIGQACRVLAFFIIFAIPSIPAYYVGLFLLGAAAAFVSGSDKALLYDTLAALGRAKDYVKISGRMNGLAIIGLVTSGFIALPISSFGYNYSYLLSIVPQLFVVGAIWLMYEPKTQANQIKNPNPIRDIWAAIQLSMSTKILQLLILLAATMQLVKQINLDFGQAFFYSFIASGTVVSLIWILGWASQAISNFLAHYINQYRWALVFLTFIFFLGLSFGPQELAPIFYVLTLFPVSIVILETEKEVQKVAPSHLRATTLSGMHMLINLAETIPIIALGWLMTQHTPAIGFQIASVVLTIFIVIVFLAIKLYSRYITSVSSSNKTS